MRQCETRFPHFFYVIPKPGSRHVSLPALLEGAASPGLSAPQNEGLFYTIDIAEARKNLHIIPIPSLKK